jgi:hypothetical protein
MFLRVCACVCVCVCLCVGAFVSHTHTFIYTCAPSQPRADTVDLSRVKVLVLDEADRLLTNATLQADLATIFAALPAKRQTMLFSATMPRTLPDNIVLREPVFRYEVGVWCRDCVRE